MTTTPTTLTEKQKKMVGLLNCYHGRSPALGGPGLTSKEMRQMFGRSAMQVARALEKKGFLRQDARGRWLTADWLREWMYLPRWRHCSLQDMRRAQ